MNPHALALFASLAIGLSLGLLGGGGSVLTVPVFVYLLGVPAKSAIAMSMPVVGLASLVGAISHGRAGNVRWGPALHFGLVAVAGAFVGARLARHLAGSTQLLLLGAAMAASATSMLRGPITATATNGADAPPTASPWLLRAVGAAVGLLTGVVGIGGGFLVVPALVLLARLPMKEAIGTSLVVITLNAASGFVGYLGQVAIDWRLIAEVVSMAIVGSLAGSRLAGALPAHTLRRAFGLFLLAIAALLIWQNVGALAPR